MNFIEYNTQSAQNRLKNPRFLPVPVKKIRDADRAPENPMSARENTACLPSALFYAAACFAAFFFSRTSSTAMTIKKRQVVMIFDSMP